MFTKRSEKGQALVIIALAAVGLFAFTALSIDGGMVFSDRRHAQNAADTAVLAAALARVRSPISTADAAAVTAGLTRAGTNGYGNDDGNNDGIDADSAVEVHICNEAGITCEGMPGGADPSEYVQVKITSTIRTTFARLVGRQTVTSVLTAVARGKPGGVDNPFPGSALVSLAQTGVGTIGGNGNIYLDVNNGGVFDNSSDNCGMNSVGNGTYNSDGGFSLVGGLCANTNSSINGTQYPGATQIEYPPPAETLKPPPDPSITCSTNGSVTAPSGLSEGKVFPGNFTGLTLNNGTYRFMPGSYCFNGAVTINGNTHITANYVDIKITAGDFQINGNSTFDCDYALIYINGGTGMHFNGNGSNTCTNVTFFAQTGSVSWNGNVANTFTAPTGGPHQEYANLLIYMPYGNSSALNINGNAGNELTGSIIAVSAPITISGNSGTTGFNCAVMGYTVTLAGNSNTTINYNPAQQYAVLQDAAISITK